MLSVLIPIYNQDVTQLVSDLHKQIKIFSIDFEIICFDDDSHNKWRDINKDIRSLDAVQYTELSYNVGRSKIRNQLAQEARFKTLLFLDGDSKITSHSFIKNYIKVLDQEHVISGGRIYAHQKPTDLAKMLHYTYGIKKEARSASQRSKKPALYFHTNNFIVTRDIALALPFPETLANHGYEDLAFSTRLQKKGISIHHIDNPVEHIDIVTADVFLAKMKESSNSLATLYTQDKIMRTPLIKAYELLKKTGTLNSFMKYYESHEENITLNLYSEQPSMRKLDLFKLYHFCQMINLEYE